jgi:hypothetical protein
MNQGVLFCCKTVAASTWHSKSDGHRASEKRDISLPVEPQLVYRGRGVHGACIGPNSVLGLVEDQDGNGLSQRRGRGTFHQSMSRDVLLDVDFRTSADLEEVSYLGVSDPSQHWV